MKTTTTQLVFPAYCRTARIPLPEAEHRFYLTVERDAEGDRGADRLQDATDEGRGRCDGDGQNFAHGAAQSRGEGHGDRDGLGSDLLRRDRDGVGDGDGDGLQDRADEGRGEGGGRGDGLRHLARDLGAGFLTHQRVEPGGKLAFGGLMEASGIPTLPRRAVSAHTEPDFAGPYIVKPRFGGSSWTLYKIVTDQGEFATFSGTTTEQPVFNFTVIKGVAA